jgi:signal transduction histidine kinase
VGSTGQRDFGEADRDLLGGLAAQAAIAIGNARLYERVRGMAAVEERERLAREMHDGLAQALTFLNFKLAVTDRLLNGGPVEPIRQELAEMQQVTAGAYAEVRQAIFGLRTMVSRGLGLVPTLSEYLHEFSQQAGIHVGLDVSEDHSQIRIAPEVEVQFVRIVQEALHNIRKHAGVRTARVRLWQEGDEVLVAIEDEGIGIDPAGPPADGHRHYGLTGMQERAESVGGTLTIRSTPGTGTQVELRVRAAGTRRGGVG